MGRHLSKVLNAAIDNESGERSAVIERVSRATDLSEDLVEQMAGGEVEPNGVQTPKLAEALEGLTREAVEEALERDEGSDDPLSEAELEKAGPVIEAAATIIKPRKGTDVFAKDGTVRVSIMRPCVSRGKRIRGLPPIYEAQMLARHAGVFNNWPMFMDHVTEELMEAMKKRGRTVSELGGRVVEGWFDPAVTFPDDEDFGFHKGAIVANVLPQPGAKAIIEADPDALHCSINAWPTGAKPGVGYGQRGMVIEGIRKRPMGSVDWVPRGGAGGRVLGPEVAEQQEHILELVEAWMDDEPEPKKGRKGKRRYSSGKGRKVSPVTEKAITEMSDEELAEHIREERPELIESLSESEESTDDKGKGKAGKKSEKGKAADKSDPEDKDRVTEADLEETEEHLSEQLREQRTEDRRHSRYERIAGEMIRESDLPDRWQRDLREQFEISEDGSVPSVLTEADTADDLRESVQEALDNAAELVAEAAGPAAVRGQGRGHGDSQVREGGEDEFTEQATELGLIEDADEMDAIAEEIY